MVSFQDVQTAYYLIAATGVLVAAIYYIQNMRNAERNRKTQLSTNITEKLGSKEFLKDFIELSNMDWRDPEAFAKKYDSSLNTETSNDSFAQRWHLWATYENLGYLMRNGLVDDEIVYNSQGVHPMIAWARCLPVLEYYRRKELGSRYFENFEYLARRMWEMGKARGLTSPGFRNGLIGDSLKDVFESKLTT